jgi:carboxyl-terminal processing protease
MLRTRYTTQAVLIIVLTSSCLPPVASEAPNEPPIVTGTPWPTAIIAPTTAALAPATCVFTSTPALTPTELPSLAPPAALYLSEVLEIIEANALNRANIDWTMVRSNAFSMAGGAQISSDTYPAIRYVLGLLRDNHHSFLLEPQDVSDARTDGHDLLYTAPSGELIEGRIGYLYLPPLGGTGDALQHYASTLHTLIRDIDSNRPCGWVVNLFGNTGGNFAPMLVGVGPLLGETPVGAFVDSDGKFVDWLYHDGQATAGDVLNFQLAQAPVSSLHGQPAVAVITSRLTASAGEAVAVAFRGRPNTRSFGEATAGLSTGNRPFYLGDGAILVLSVVRFADRMGTVYRGAIYPDVETTRARQAAIEWLLNLPDCRGTP